jgi:ABC-type nitrate/sulfonate/bicarbonate transport system substrate-binding protein
MAMNRRNWVAILTGAVILSIAGVAGADFQRDVGDVKVGPVAPMTTSTPLKVPFITWGGDMATFHANGGLKTVPGSTFEKQGLHLELFSGDDFVQQTRDYVAGKTPFLRGTLSQIGMATQVIGSNEKTRGVAILQLTWSLGDHMVGRKEFRNLNDMKGKTFCLQQGGPHVGFLDDILDSAKLTWDDIHVVWAKDVTATKERPNDNPAAMFRKDPKIDACFVISPDMAALCGDRDKAGDSKISGQVDGAHVVVSTGDMNRSIADVYICRKDFFNEHKDIVDKFIYGYLKGCEDVAELYKAHENPAGSKAQKEAYEKLLELTQTIYGKAAIPTLDDAHGLVADCDFANYDGNARFFTLGEKNTIGFEALQKKSLDVAQSQEYVTRRIPLEKIDFRFKNSPFTTLKKYVNNSSAEVAGGSGTATETALLYSFSITFAPSEDTFSAEKYGKDFQRAVETANKFGACAIQIRGHADPLRFVQDVLEAGQKQGLIKEVRTPDETRYTYNGQPLDMKDTKKLIKLANDGVFEKALDANGDPISPKRTVEDTLSLSERRAEIVKRSIIDYARKEGTFFSEGQFGVTGVGVSEPVSPFPKTREEMQSNRRVEFRLVRIKAER